MGGTNMNEPPDCSGCHLGRNCKAVWLTCYDPKPGKDTSVYCSPSDKCDDIVCVSNRSGYPGNMGRNDPAYPISQWSQIDACRDRSGTWTLAPVPYSEGWLPPTRTSKKCPPGEHFIHVLRPCGDMCPEYNKFLGPPAYSRGASICVGGISGKKNR